ncbi:MAG: right-handed parallel beta-helix repeat-containing protein [Proteobacteria bacterium]|nr:right-handed parallel beta-helix repeat-containing protein [Pseudomonadota bacterium]
MRLVSSTRGFVVLIWVMASASIADAATYYVRTDGGTADQCTGLTDAPYAGSGTNQACAWSHPFWALNGSGVWKIQGGDTLVIGSGSYRMGIDAPNTGWCEAEWAYNCHLPPLPSGPSPDNPTRIVGAGWDQGCTDPPELWGVERAWQIISLAGTDNATIACMELTDHSGCVEHHANPAIQCERDTPPFGDWAAIGITASDSSNVTLKNLNIHGLAAGGIHAGRLTDWTVENVRIAGNGWVGWDGDIDGNDANTGTLSFKKWTVEWNGCAESYPDETINNCWAQTAGGYGDGVGTGETGGNWVIEDSIFRYNTSDGLDLLYTRLSSQIVIRRTQSYGNAGDQIKVNGPTRIENSLVKSNCGFFNGKSFTYNVDDCRAGGAALVFALRQGNAVSVVNSTLTGHGDCLLTAECDDSSCNGSETITIQNNIFIGNQEFMDPSDTTCYIWFDQENFYNTQIDYNVVYRAKIGGVGLSVNDISQDPLVVDDTLETFDGHLKTGSPAIDSGLAVGSLGGLIPDHDLEGISRPQGSGVDRGAYERVNSPELDIKANGSNGPLSVSPGTPVSVTINLAPGDKAGENADWWIATHTPFASPIDWYSYVYPAGWMPGINLCAQAPLFALSAFEVLNMTLPVGDYTFYFALDDPDGAATGPWWGMDSVEVTVQ